MRYEDFKIRFLNPHNKDMRFPVYIETPAGNDQCEFLIPFSAVDLAHKLLESGLATRSGVAEKAEIKKDVMKASMNDLGRKLFQAIFSNKSVSDLYIRNLSRMQEHSDLGLRIKLCFSPEYPEIANLLNLPWEFLFDPMEKRDFLNLFQCFPIVRYIDLKCAVKPIKIERPIRILVMISSPSNYPKLDVNKERKLLQEAFAGHSDVQVDFLRQASLPALRDALCGSTYHIFHFIGHGGFEEETGRGVLIFEEGGKGVPVPGENLRRGFRDRPIGLVFLNACEAARMSAEKDPFAGIASALMAENIQAVVAMQYPISDQAAIIFSKKFYSYLAEGDPVDQAVARSRQDVFVNSPGLLEWGTPVLFTRSEDGVVFDFEQAPTVSGPVYRFCRKCGSQLVPHAVFCNRCGTTAT